MPHLAVLSLPPAVNTARCYLDFQTTFDESCRLIACGVSGGREHLCARLRGTTLTQSLLLPGIESRIGLNREPSSARLKATPIQSKARL